MPVSEKEGQGPFRARAEALLIMGFDDSFRFPDGLGVGLRYQMVVDAVSPTFSYVAAQVIREMLEYGRS